MEIRKDEEDEKVEEKEEEIEEEEKEEEKFDSKEEEKKNQKMDSLKIEEQNQEKEEEIVIQKNQKEEIKNKEIKEIKENNEDKVENQEKKNSPEIQEQDLESTSTYILKYTRKGDELKELAVETGLSKSENCLFMLNIKLIKSDSISIIEQDEDKEKENEKDTPKEPENFLVFCCHEIAAIYFDEIYERIYTLKDLANENKYFKVFESTEEAKMVIDETIRTNEKNAKKIFIGFKDKELKLHMKLSFFDKEKEIVLNIPKKPLSDEDKVNLLPEFLKEIQDKMNHLNEENKKLKVKKLAFGNRSKENNRYNYKNNIVNESIEISKEKKDKNNISFDNNDVKFNEFKAEEINISSNINNRTIDINNNNINNSVNIGNGDNTAHKKVKKLKVIKKKHSKPEENFF